MLPGGATRVWAHTPLAKNGPKHLRWALIEAATHAAWHPIYAERYRCTKTRLGRQRGPKVAQVDLARRLSEACRVPELGRSM
jgi:transposase